MKAEKILRPDSKGRICLGSLTKDISGYKVVMNEKTREIVLKPYTEVVFQEQWILDNKEVRSSIRKGVKQSFNNETIYKGSFAQYVNKEK